MQRADSLDCQSKLVPRRSVALLEEKPPDAPMSEEPLDVSTSEGATAAPPLIDLGKHAEKAPLFDDLAQNAGCEISMCVVIKAFESLLREIESRCGVSPSEIEYAVIKDGTGLHMTNELFDARVVFECVKERSQSNSVETFTTLKFYLTYNRLKFDFPSLYDSFDEFVCYPTSTRYWHKKEGERKPATAVDVSVKNEPLEVSGDSVVEYEAKEEFCVVHKFPLPRDSWPWPKPPDTAAARFLARFVGKNATTVGTVNDLCISVVTRRAHPHTVICLNGIAYDSTSVPTLSGLTTEATLYDFSYNNGELVLFKDIESLIRNHQSLLYSDLVKNAIHNLPYLRLLDDKHKTMAAAEIRKPAYSLSHSSDDVDEFLKQYPAPSALKRKRSGEGDANDPEPKAVDAFCKRVQESSFFISRKPLSAPIPFRLHVDDSQEPSATLAESGRVDCHISRTNLKANDPEERFRRRAVLDTLTKHINVEKAAGVFHAVKPSARRCASELLSTMLFVEFCGKATEPLETIWERLFKDAENTLDPARSEDCLSHTPESMDTTSDALLGRSSSSPAPPKKPRAAAKATQARQPAEKEKGKGEKESESAPSPVTSPSPAERDPDATTTQWKTAQRKKAIGSWLALKDNTNVKDGSLLTWLSGFVFGGIPYVPGERAQKYASLYAVHHEKNLATNAIEKLKESRAGQVTTAPFADGVAGEFLQQACFLQAKRLRAIGEGVSKKKVLENLKELYSEEAVLLSNALLAVMGETGGATPVADGLEHILPHVLAYWRGLFTQEDPCMTITEEPLLTDYLANLARRLFAPPEDARQEAHTVSAKLQNETLLFLANFIRAALPIHYADNTLKAESQMKTAHPSDESAEKPPPSASRTEPGDDFADTCDKSFTKWFDALYKKSDIWHNLNWFYENAPATEVDGKPAFDTMTSLVENLNDFLLPMVSGKPNLPPFIRRCPRRGFRVAQMMMGEPLCTELSGKDSVEGRFYRLADRLSAQLEGPSQSQAGGPEEGFEFPLGVGASSAEMIPVRRAWTEVYTNCNDAFLASNLPCMRFWQRLATVKSWHAAVMEIYVMFVCKMVVTLDLSANPEATDPKMMRIHCISALFYIIMLRRLGESNGEKDILGGKYLLSETWKPRKSDPRVALLCKDAETTRNDPVFKLLAEYIGIGEDEIKEAVDFFGAPKTWKRKGAEPEPGSAASALADVPLEKSGAGQSGQPVVSMEYDGRSPGQAATKVSSEQDDVLVHGLSPFVIHFLFGSVHSALDRVAAKMLSRAAFAHEVAMLSTTSQSRAVASAACFLPMEEEGGAFSPALERSSPREHAIAPPAAEALFARMQARTPAENALWIARYAVRFHDQRASEDDLVSYTESCTSLSVRIAAALLRMRALFTGITFTPTDPVSAVNLAKAVKRITTTDFTAAQRTSLDTILSGVSLILVAWWRTLRTFDLDDDIVRLAETLSRVTGDLAGSDMFENITADEYFSGSYCPKFHPISSPVVALLGAGQGFLIPPRKSREEGKSPPSSTQKWSAIDIRQYWRKKRTERDKIVF